MIACICGGVLELGLVGACALATGAATHVYNKIRLRQHLAGRAGHKDEANHEHERGTHEQEVEVRDSRHVSWRD